MKAWIVRCGDYDGWTTVVHAETAGKAKQSARKNVFDTGNYLDYSVKRLSGLDDKPITYQNLEAVGFHFLDDWDDEPLPEAEFTNDCQCKVCKDASRTV